VGLTDVKFQLINRFKPWQRKAISPSSVTFSNLLDCLLIMKLNSSSTLPALPDFFKHLDKSSNGGNPSPKLYIQLFLPESEPHDTYQWDFSKFKFLMTFFSLYFTLFYSSTSTRWICLSFPFNMI